MPDRNTQEKHEYNTQCYISIPPTGNDRKPVPLSMRELVSEYEKEEQKRVKRRAAYLKFAVFCIILFLCSAASGYAGLAPKEIAFPATFVLYILSGLLISIFLENETTGIDSHEKPALIIAWPLFLVLWGVAFALYGLALLFVAALKRLFPVILFANISKLVNVRCWQLLHWVLAASIILLLITILGGDRHFLWEAYSLPNGYYQLLRLAVTATAAYLGYNAVKNKAHPLCVLACAALVLIFQPLAPISFERGTWLWIDLAIAPALLLCAKYCNKSGKPENEQT